MKGFDDFLHQPIRLRVMAALAALDPGARLSFIELREIVEATDGNLGAHILRLEERGYVRLEKLFIGRKPCTFVVATARGRAAFESHVDALERIVRGAGKS